jgi:hypothetical protein
LYSFGLNFYLLKSEKTWGEDMFFISQLSSSPVYSSLLRWDSNQKLTCACNFLNKSEILAECLRKLSLCAAKSIFLTTILLRKQNVEKHCKIDFIFLALPLILKVCFFSHHRSLHNLQNLTLRVLPEICSKVLGEGTIRKLLLW